MKGVEVLRLHENGALQLADAAEQGQTCILRNLKQLEVLALLCDYQSFLPQIYWLLSCAHKLSVLSASGQALPWLPPLAHLKHLVIKVEGFTDGIDSLVSGIHKTINLETLSLRTSQKENTSALQLEDFPSLRVVALHNLRPSRTCLPNACKLHISGDVGFDISKVAAWDGAMSSLSSFGFSNVSKDIHGLPGVFGRLQQLSNVSVDLGRVGTTARLVSLKGLAHVQKIRISGSALHLRVPNKVSWKSVEFVGKQSFKVEFDNAKAFASAVRACTFKYQHPMDACIPRLCGALKACGVDWRIGVEDSGLTVIRFPDKGQAYVFGCGCGACMACLREAGVAEAPTGEWIKEEDLMSSQARW